MKKIKIKIDFLKIVISFSFLFIVCVDVLDIYLNTQGYYISDTLLTCVHAFFGTELVVGGWLQNVKKKMEFGPVEQPSQPNTENIKEEEGKG